VTVGDRARCALLTQQLAEAEAIIAALLSGQVDAVVEPSSKTPLLLAKAQDALRHSQKRLRDIIDGLGPAIFVALLTPEGILVEVNHSPLAAAGLKPEDVLGKPFDETPWWSASEEIRQQLRDAIARAAAGEASRYDVRTRGKGNEIIDIDFSLQPLRDESGKVVFLIPSASVITERKQMESALRESDTQNREVAQQLKLEKERLVDAQSVAKVGNWETAFPPGPVVWSQQMHTIFETDSDPSYEKFLALIHPADRAGVEDAFLQSVAKPGTHSMEHRLLLPDGRIKFVEQRWHTVNDGGGHPVGAVGTCQDISDRKLAENDLRQSDEKFRQLADNISDVFWIRSPNMHELHYVSPAFERIWGISVADLYADPRQWSSYIVPADRERVLAAFDSITRSESTIDVEYSIKRPDGEIRGIRSRGYQVRDSENRLIRIIGIVTDVTERNRSAEALRASLGEFRSLAEAMPQMVWITRSDGWNIYFNPQWTDYTGLTLEESYGRGWSTPFHPDDQERAREAWQLATDTTGEYSVECRLRRADGVYRWWLIRGVPIRDAAGNVLKWFGTCTDIHGLKLAELEVTRTNRALTMLSACSDALARAETEAQLLSEVCRVAVDSGGYLMAWVGYAEKDERRSITPIAHAGREEGYLATIACTWSEKDPLGQGPAGRVIRTGQAVVVNDFADDATLQPWFDQAQQRGYHGVICLPLRDPNGTFGLLGLYSAEANQPGDQEIKLLQELADNTAFGIGSLRARSERRRMQAAVTEQAALLDIAREAIQVKDMQGKIIYWNKGAENLYGWTAAEMLGRKSAATICEGVTTLVEAEAQLLEQGEWQGEMIKKTKDGRDITVEVRWTLVLDANGQPKSILAIDADVTLKKTLESQLMVSDRMASVGTLAAGVAHEINNPLAAVMANLEYVSEIIEQATGRNADTATGRSVTMAAGLMTDIKGPLDDAREAAQRVRLIVRDLKIFSRSPSEDAPGPVDVKAAMESSLGMAWNEIRHRARLVKDYGLVPAVEANEGRLGQVFLNLLVNAAQALPEGRAERNVIRVTTRLAGERVITEVSDTGPGIPPHIIGRIFDAFFTTKAAGVGTGLGLAICHRIVTDMGGELTVESEVGVGTTFRVALPLARTEERAPADPIAKPAVTGRRGRILVVDDEVTLVKIVTRLLSREHEVVSTVSAREALEFCVRGDKFDLILCDLMMPEMTGMDLHRELSIVAPDMANRMIFLTGGAFTHQARSFLTDPPKEHIEKPFDAANIRAIVQRYLRSAA
jgi:PAS domain S-box-containing protein